jgi:LacI family transcriptional regulator
VLQRANLPEIVRHPVDPPGAFEDTLALLDGPDAPTALFSSQNLLTIEVIRALHQHGRQHEVAHIGFDDIPLAAAVDPPVTVVAQDALAIGRAAAELLFSRLDGHRGPSRRVVLPAPLIQRGSGELRP